MKEKVYPILPDIRENPTAPNMVNNINEDRGSTKFFRRRNKKTRRIQ